jgi:hypothetical protein
MMEEGGSSLPKERNVMGISDMISGKQTDPLDKTTDFMNLRKLPSRDSLSEKLGQASYGVENERGIDHLIQGLVEMLPKRGGKWPLYDRVKWLRLAAGIFDLGYQPADAERGEISIAIMQEESTHPPSSSTARTQGPMRHDSDA